MASGNYANTDEDLPFPQNVDTDCVLLRMQNDETEQGS